MEMEIFRLNPPMIVVPSLLSTTCPLYYRVTYKEDMSWPSVCARVHESLPQQRLPTGTDISFTDLQTAQRCIGRGDMDLETLGKEHVPGLRDLPYTRELNMSHLVDAWHICFNEINRLSHIRDTPFNPPNTVELPEEILAWTESISKTGRRHWMVSLIIGTSKTGAIVPIANQAICFNPVSIFLCLSASLSLSPSTMLICYFSSRCLALVIRDTYESRRRTDGSRRHIDGSRRHTDGSRRHIDDRVSHFRQICIRYS
eukprot:sb/3468549/